MLAEGLISKDNDYGIRTKFTGVSWRPTPGFISDNGSINVTESTVRIRCVKDIVIE